MTSGDGGQVLVDPSQGSPNNDCPLGACFVYGTFFGVSPYRITDGGGVFFSRTADRERDQHGDRSEFYIPFTMNQNNPDQLFTGTYRLYRTDDARETATWHVMSGDLTTRLPRRRPRTAPAAATSRRSASAAASEVYVGTDDGLVWYSPDGQTSDTPTFVKVNRKPNGMPNRPVSWFAVDRSNERIAYMAYNGYSAATPANPGHVFATTDGGKHWTNISGNLPDVPVNSLRARRRLRRHAVRRRPTSARWSPTTTAPTGRCWQPACRRWPTGSSTSIRRTGSWRPARTAAAPTASPTAGRPCRRSC